MRSRLRKQTSEKLKFKVLKNKFHLRESEQVFSFMKYWNSISFVMTNRSKKYIIHFFLDLIWKSVIEQMILSASTKSLASNPLFHDLDFFGIVKFKEPFFYDKLQKVCSSHFLLLLIWQNNFIGCFYFYLRFRGLSEWSTCLM